MTCSRTSSGLVVSATLAAMVCLLDRSSRPVMAGDLKLLGPSEITTEFHGEDRPLALPRTRRLILSDGDRLGATAHWSAGPFVHNRDRRFVADIRLELGAVNGRNGAVSVLVARDETNVTAGDRQAAVSAALVRPGISGIELQVSFVPRDASTLASGIYTSRVVGTITGN